MDLKGFLKRRKPQHRRDAVLPASLEKGSAVKPLIAAVEGYALAGGMELMISCDLIVANKDSKFGIPEAKRGLAAGAGGLMKLPYMIPPKIAMELALTGDFIDTARAYELGLLNRVVDGPALDAAIELAGRITANGPLAVKVSKQIVEESRGWGLDERWEKQAKLLPQVFMSEDAREGSLAFAEKRAPNWKGK